MQPPSSAAVRVRVRRTGKDSDLPLPGYATSGSSGMDLRACISQSVTIPPGGRALIGTGLSLALPPGTEAQIRPRSGLAAEHGVTLLNAPGTIDSDYRGEIRLVLINHGLSSYTVHRGDRIGQMVVGQVLRVVLEEVEQLPESARSAGGFGHTGKS